MSGVVFPTLRKRSDSKLKRCNGEEGTKSLLRYEELFANKVSDLHGITYLTMNTCFRNDHVPMRRSLKVNEYEIFVKGRETLSHGWSAEVLQHHLTFNLTSPLKSLSCITVHATYTETFRYAHASLLEEALFFYFDLSWSTSARTN